MFYIKEEKEKNNLNELNKKRNKIQIQILQENKILRKIIDSSIIKLKKNITNRNDTNLLDLNIKSFYSTNNNEGDSSINIYHLQKENNNISQQKDFNKNMLEKNDNNINYLYNINIINKKREKSYENRKDRNNKEKIINPNINNTKNLNKYEKNEIK